MNARKYILTGLSLLALTALPAWAERFPATAKELTKAADLIVTGTVKDIYSFEASYEVNSKVYVKTHYVLEIAVETVDKETGVKKGELVYARGWSLRPAIKGGNGHYIPSNDTLMPWVTDGKVIRPMDLPRGQAVRAFLENGENGGFDIVYPNGIEVLPASSKKKTK